jgi:cysteine desulfurase
LSGHKLHSPQGIGALYVRKGITLPPFIIGGAQEHGRRAGTPAVANIVGLGAACELAASPDGHELVRRLRDKLEDGILEKIPNALVNGNPDRDRRLPNTSNISFQYVEGENIMMLLDEEGICVSTGSACHSGNHQASPTFFARKVLKSHLRQRVDISGPAYQCLKSLLLNPTCGSRWMVQVLPISVMNLRARLHLKYPSAAAEGIQETNPNLSCRSNLNYPPAAAGGI